MSDKSLPPLPSKEIVLPKPGTDEEVFVYSRKTGANLRFSQTKHGLVCVRFQDLEVLIAGGVVRSGQVPCSIYTEADVS